MTDMLKGDLIRMLYKSRALMMALGLVCAGGVSANAADLCVSLSGISGLLVAKDASLQTPPVSQANTCQPMSGFEQGGLGGAFTGIGCVDINGATLLFHYSYHNAHAFNATGDGQNYFQSGFCRFRLPNASGQPISGSCRSTVLFGPPATQSFLPSQSAILSVCDVQVPEDLPP